MNAKLVKQIRKHVRKKYAFMSEETLYEYDPLGFIRLSSKCQRAFSQNIKRNMKRNG